MAHPELDAIKLPLARFVGRTMQTIAAENRAPGVMARRLRAEGLRLVRVGLQLPTLGLGPVSESEWRAVAVAIRFARAEGIASVVEALRWFQRHHGAFMSAPCLQQCGDEILETKQLEGLAPLTLARYRSQFKRFLQVYGTRRPVEVQPDEIARFLSQWHHSTTRRVWWEVLYMLFEWCRRRKFLSDNPVPLAMAVPKAVRGLGVVLTPAETRELLARTMRTGAIGFWALALFAGLRTYEIKRLHQTGRPWSFVREASAVIDITHEISKSYARSVPIRPVLKLWLAWMRREGVPFFPVNHHTRSKAVRTAVLGRRCGPEDVAARGARQYSHNIARRTFLSYRLAEAGSSYVEVAGEAGNSEKILRKYYQRKVTRVEAAAYFALTPESVGG